MGVSLVRRGVIIGRINRPVLMLGKLNIYKEQAKGLQLSHPVKGSILEAH
jgi:hypothetical protein